MTCINIYTTNDHYHSQTDLKIKSGKVTKKLFYILVFGMPPKGRSIYNCRIKPGFTLPPISCLQPLVCQLYCLYLLQRNQFCLNSNCKHKILTGLLLNLRELLGTQPVACLRGRHLFGKMRGC